MQIVKTGHFYFMSGAVFIATTWPVSTPADLLMTLRGQPGDSILFFELTGSSVVTGSSGLSLGFGVTLQDFNAFGPALGSVDLGSLDLLSGSASVMNPSRGTEVPVTKLFLQDLTTLPSSGDRFGVITTAPYWISSGDTVAWQGSGTVDLSQQSASFTDLSVGVGLGLTEAPGIPSGEGRLIIQVIPEPRVLTFWLSSAALMALAVLKSKRHADQKSNHPRQPAPAGRQACIRTSAARRGCAHRWAASWDSH